MIELNDPNMKICPHCHAPIKKETTICWKCGKNTKRSWWRRITDEIDAVSYLFSRGKSTVRLKRIAADKEAIAQLISSLEYEDDSVRKDVAHSLANIAQKDPELVRGAIPKLITLLEDENGHTRGYAAQALGLLGAEEALDPLKKLLNDFYTESDIFVVPKSTFNPAFPRSLPVRDVALKAIEMIEKRRDDYF